MTPRRALIWLLVITQAFWAVPVETAPRPAAPEADPAPAAAATTTASAAATLAPEAVETVAVAPPPAVRVNRTVPSVKPVPQAPVFSAWPTREELGMARVFEEPLVPVRGVPTPEENRALARALQAYLSAGSGENVGPLLAFLEGHAVSAWRPALQLNMALVYRRTGYYTRALRALEEAWAVAKADTAPAGRAVADRALGELLQLSSRLGRHRRLEELLIEAAGRDVGGAAGEMVEQGKQAQWLIRTHPDRTLLCGPSGLERILAFGSVRYQPDPKIREFKASPHGSTLAQMRDLAGSVGMPFQMAKRVDVQGEITAPALVHWAVGHFAALLKAEGGRLLIEDPAFGPARWVSRKAFDEEASGYALVSPGDLPRGWRAVPEPEGETVWGMGPTSESDIQCQTCGDHQSGGAGGGGGCPGGFCSKEKMAAYSFHTMLVALHVFDAPVGYSPARGPAVQFEVNYHQREVFQPQTFSYSNLGPKWTFAWMGYVEDDPTNGLQPANVYLRGGGQETYTNYNTTTRTYDYSTRSRGQLVRTADSPVTYERRLPDGTVEVYGQPNGALTFPRKVFLTRTTDPQGQSVQLTYDASLRLVAITDAIGQVTTVSYELPADPLKITKVTDPFGRFAAFGYDASGRLSQITDVIGITSSFAYGTGDFIKAMTTPYGTTTFRMAEDGRRRWIEATDPLGGTERLEYLNAPGDGVAGRDAAVIPYDLPSADYPTGFYSHPPNQFYRNTFYWSKRAMALAPGDYATAKMTHWLHTNGLTTTAGVIENEKQPLESRRTFYQYPDMAWQGTGTHVTPSAVGRVMEDGTSQIWRYEYNARGHKTKEIDPLGRETVYVYGTNNVPDANPTAGEGRDLLQIKQKNGATYDVLQSYTYNDKHQPLTITDARGAVTTYTYNTAGQVLTVRTPPVQGQSQGPLTTFDYDTNGYLQSVAGPVAGAVTGFTYDGYGRKRTSTDAAGLVVTYDYDALDRVTRVTYPDTTYEQTVYKWLDAERRRDRLGRWTQTFYDAMRRPVATRDALGGTTQYQYGAAGCSACTGGGDRLTKLIDANANATSWDYDVQGRVTRETRANGAYETYTYEASSSRLAQKTDRRNITTTFEYFLDGKLKRKSYSDTTPAVSYTYDPVDGLMLTAANGTDTLTWTYDNLDRVANEASTKNASTVGYTYDDAGNRATLSLDGSNYLTYGYDPYSRLTSITRASNVFGFGYDTPSRRTSMTYPNGVVTTYGYDSESRLTSIAANKGPTPITSFTYVLDNVGNRTRKTTLDWAEDYAYDDLYRLVSADRSGAPPARWRWAYDSVGNRTADQTGDASNGSTYNNLNQLQSRAPGGALAFRGTTNEPATVTIAGQPATTTATNTFAGSAPVGSGNTDVAVSATDASGNTRTNTYRVSESGATASYTYDPNGNLTQKTEGADTWTYSWNAENQLTKVEKNGAEVARFGYDPLGRRVEKVVGGGSTNYTYESVNILREIRGALTRKYVQGRGADQPYAVDDGSAVTYFHADTAGSIVRVTDSAGAVVSARQYDVWGNLDGGSTADGYAFTGREWDPETRLYYYRARYYDANAARFISADGAGFAAGLNHYVYVDDNPVNFIDPTGHYKFTPSVDFQGWWNEGGRTAIENATVGIHCYPNSCGRWQLSFDVGLRIRARYSKFCPWFSKPHEQRHIDQAIANVKGMADKYLAPRETTYGSAAECFAAGREGKRAFDAAPDAEFNKGHADIDHYIPCVMQL